MAEPNVNKEGDEGNTQSAEPLQQSLPARTLLLHNAALRQNFEQLKQLFMKLSEANISLQETCRRLQLEKKLPAQVHGSMASLKTEELPAIFPSKESDAIMKEIDVLRLERDQALTEKEALELEYIKLLSLKEEENGIREKAGDLADKCKFLEIDLETACVAGEAAHSQLLKVAYEKDVIILELEKAAQKLQENICMVEEERKADSKTWSKEREELVKTMNEIERDKAKCNEMSQTLKSEIGDLHGMLDAMEHATQDAELRHANAVEFVKEEEKGVVEEAPVSSARQCSKYGHFGEAREELSVPTFSESKRWPLHMDMTHLAQRQMKLLDSLVAT